MEKISWHNSSDFFYHIIVKFTISLISLSSAYFFVCYPNHLNYCCQQMRGAYKNVYDYWPFNPWEWLSSNFTFQYHPWIEQGGHYNKGKDNQLKNLLTVKQILPASTLGNV